MNALLDSAAIALQAIWASKQRSFMTVLGNIVAVTSIISVVALIQGLNASVKDAILNQAGADSFSVQQFPITTSDEEFDKARYNPRITSADARAIQRYGDEVAAVMLQSQNVGAVSYRDKQLDAVTIHGVSAAFTEFSTFDAERGRLMSSVEVERSRPVVLLGWEVADRLFGSVDPLEKHLQIEGLRFRIVGISKKRGSFLGQSQDDFAVIPLSRFEVLYGSRRQLSITVKPRSLERISTAMDEATVALRSARRLRPKDPNNFGMFTSDTFLTLYYAATSGIFAVLVGVVALSLVVGGIVIMNIMLMVVSERTREIGLRKALGARRSDIMAQMLTESVVLSVFGGVIGTLFGTALAAAVSALTPVPASIEPWSVMVGIGITALVGLFFGLYPASLAASLDPIEALRKE
ncbi:MAG: ABC transporter permease [Acidimicrobiia bacterium]|nr:ABC transporter permease [Acidimicrobiia bacterium]